MKRYRRLRRLIPAPELVRRRAAGETLRELAVEYGVSHTTLGRYFARPEVARQVRETVAPVRRERRAAAAAERVAQKLEEQEVRRKAEEQAALERRLEVIGAMLAAGRSRRRRSAYESWLDEHDARQPVTRPPTCAPDPMISPPMPSPQAAV